MDQMARGAKIPVNMLLSTDLVREARALTPDLEATVERLLAAHIVRERAKRADEQRGIDAVIAWTNEFVAIHGLPGEEFSPL
jgi:hypothetical protein